MVQDLILALEADNVEACGIFKDSIVIFLTEFKPTLNQSRGILEPKNLSRTPQLC